MQDEQKKLINNILSYLSDKERERFSGGIKMGFEKGQPSSFAETYCPDKDIKATGEDFDLKAFIRKACEDGFYGTLFVVYEDGVLTHYNRVRTIQGKVLEKVLGCQPAPNKKCVIKMGVRANA
jgi:hypothetical protein